MSDFVDEVHMGLDHDNPDDVVEDQDLTDFDPKWAVEEGEASDDEISESGESSS